MGRRGGRSRRRKKRKTVPAITMPGNPNAPGPGPMQRSDQKSLRKCASCALQVDQGSMNRIRGEGRTEVEAAKSEAAIADRRSGKPSCGCAKGPYRHKGGERSGRKASREYLRHVLLAHVRMYVLRTCDYACAEVCALALLLSC